MNTLESYGWDEARVVDVSPFTPARVIADHGQQYKIAMPEELPARLAGALVHKLQTVAMPKIGDWVAVEVADNQATIQRVLPRRSEIVRGHVGVSPDKQVIAANVDLAFVVQPLDHDFSVERLERYIFQLNQQSVAVVILLNKADSAHDIDEKKTAVEALGVPTLVMSALHDADVAAVESFIKPGQTAVILGSSGAGKSTLTNRLLGEERQATQEIRERDSKGRHTTVHRELFVLPGGGMIIDTPGIRELQLWGSVDDLELTFPEIFAAIRTCRYKNCSHGNEEGCAINAGLSDGSIDPARYRAYLNFKRELDALESKRGFVDERRTQQTKASAKRRRARRLRHELERDFDNE